MCRLHSVNDCIIELPNIEEPAFNAKHYEKNTFVKFKISKVALFNYLKGLTSAVLRGLRATGLGNN